MKFEEASLIEYLVKNLEPLTEADPAILAKYVVALLKNDKPPSELQKLCTDKLDEFLGNGANPFTAKLFEAIEDGSIANLDGTLDLIPKPEPPLAPITGEIHPLRNSSPKEEKCSSSSSEPSSDPEEKEVSDDDDRNHKHRRKEARQSSFETDGQEQFIRRHNRKQNKPYDNGHSFLNADIQASEIQRGYNPTSDRNISSKFDKRRSDLTPLLRASLDSGTRTRFSIPPIRNDPGLRFDFSTSIGRPVGRGRGRGTVPWNQYDLSFNPHDALNFASQMAPQGPRHPGLFVGVGLPSSASTQNPSWAGFGFIPGMSNGIMDPLNPLGLQGSLRTAVNAPLNLGMPHQRCRDFEERGFCLRGDMCPMEHGLNRIVVEDVQSLSQFNLPVSIPSSHALGIQGGTGSLPPVPPPSGQLANTKSIPSRSSKSGAVNDGAGELDDVPSISGGADADVYDPDQPLWSNEHPDTSVALPRIQSPNNEDEPSWDDDSPAHQGFKSDGIESEVTGRRVAGNIGSLNTSSSVWGRINSGDKSGTRNGIGNVAATSHHGEETNDDHGKATHKHCSINQRKNATHTEIVTSATTSKSIAHINTDSGHKIGREFQKALRTLYVNGIPQKSNRRDALLAHFEKFGEVIDIYIPLNSEKAFVQFSRREEAEAALKSPDAVMGNRFIKLSWANRDRIFVDGQSSGTGYNNSVQSPSVVATPVPSRQLIARGENEFVPISAQRGNDISVAETPMPVNGPLLSNAPKAVPPVTKKPESSKLLEELRRKQESLAKKREEFRRQLDKFEKQAISNKRVDAVSEQTAKRQKIDPGIEAEKVAVPINPGPMAEKTSERRNSEDFHVSNGSKACSNSLPQSLKDITQISTFPVSSPNRFKLDNRSTSFRILPPLPAGFASVDVLKDYFARYGVISSVVLEGPGHSEKDGLALSENCSARITFTTRHSAERAYQTGKCWEGHNLQFKWLTVSSNSNSDSGIQETSSSFSPRLAPKADGHPVIAVLSSPGAEKSVCIANSDVSANGKVGTTQDIGGRNYPSSSSHKFPDENIQFSATMSLHENVQL